LICLLVFSPLAFPPITYMRSHSPQSCYMPVHLILLDFVILIITGEDYKSGSSTLCSFLQPPVTLSLFGPNTLLSTLFSNTLSLCSYLNAREQESQPHKTIGKIIVFYILFFMIFDSRREDKRFWTEW
jgi:hypothetical protein